MEAIAQLIMERSLATFMLEQLAVIMTGQKTNAAKGKFSTGQSDSGLVWQQNRESLVRLKFNGKLKTSSASYKAAIGIQKWLTAAVRVVFQNCFVEILALMGFPTKGAQTQKSQKVNFFQKVDLFSKIHSSLRSRDKNLEKGSMGSQMI